MRYTSEILRQNPLEQSIYIFKMKHRKVKQVLSVGSNSGREEGK
jgi:hypothetical protein